MAPLIRSVLGSLIGEEDADKIDIVSNDVNIHSDGKWEIQYRHPSRCAHRGTGFTDKLNHSCVWIAVGLDMTKVKRSCPTADFPTLQSFSSSVTVSQVCYYSQSYCNALTHIFIQTCLLPGTQMSCS